jgi:hypothetical protein
LTDWRSVQRELTQWALTGRRLDLWWRDDDTRAPSARLDQLLASAQTVETPLTLAVIPDGDRSDLAARIAFEPLVTVIQHGVDHVNFNRFGPAGEFPLGCPRNTLQTRLARARAQLEAMPQFMPVFCPPWNAVHPQLALCLAAEGYRGLSAQGEPVSVEHGLARIDVHLDLLRWKGGARFRGAEAFLKAFVQLARARRRSEQWDQPIGLLTHHLVHDEAAWRFLGEFLGFTASHHVIRWRRVEDLLATVSEPAASAASQDGLAACG